MLAELGGDAARESDDRGLGGGVHGEDTTLGAIGIAAEIDDRAAAEFFHARHHGLDGEERGTLVHRDAVVVVLGRHVHEFVAIVVGHVIDEYREIAQLPGGIADGSLQRRDIGDVGLAKPGLRMTRGRDFFQQRLRGRFGNVDEGHARALSCESFGQTAANARATTGDEDGFSFQGWIDRAVDGHGPSSHCSIVRPFTTRRHETR
jgi:hypothetical protein